MSKGGQPDRVTNVTEPWSGAQPALLDIIGQTQNLYRGGPGFAQPDFNPLQQAAQGGTLGYAGNLMGTTGNALDATNFGLTDVLNPASNPSMRGYMDAAIRPLEQQLTENLLPAISRGATQTGNYSSTRRGIAEGLAGRGFLDAAGDITSRIASQGYGQGLDHQARTMALLPQTMQAGMMPFSLTGNVGDQIASREYQNQMAPYQALEWYNSQINPYAGAGGTSTQSSNGRSNWAAGGLGGGLAGAGAASMMGTAIWPLALMGGLFGALSS